MAAILGSFGFKETHFFGPKGLFQGAAPLPTQCALRFEKPCLTGSVELARLLHKLG
jgi:hypothetical protein